MELCAHGLSSEPIKGKHPLNGEQAFLTEQVDELREILRMLDGDASVDDKQAIGQGLGERVYVGEIVHRCQNRCRVLLVLGCKVYDEDDSFQTEPFVVDGGLYGKSSVHNLLFVPVSDRFLELTEPSCNFRDIGADLSQELN